MKIKTVILSKCSSFKLQLRTILLVFLFLNSYLYADPGNSPKLNAKQKKFNLCAQILFLQIEDQPNNPFFGRLEKAVDEYDIDEIAFRAFDINRQFLSYPNYSKVAKPINQKRFELVQKTVKRFKDKGVKISIGQAGPGFPEDLFEKYPEMQDISNGLFCKFIADGTEEYFHRFPQVDCIEHHMWETPFMNNHVYFRDMTYPGDIGPYYAPADYMATLLEAFAKGAKAAGKEFQLLTFSHYPWQENILIEALGYVDPSLPIRFDNMHQSGDWNPYRPVNRIMLAYPRTKGLLHFDAIGEYWGQGFVPYCYPETIKEKIQYVMSRGVNIDGLSAVVNWINYSNCFDTFNDINFYALSRFAYDPDASVDDIWNEWAQKKFGEKAAAKVISALKRTDDIGNLIYYIYGTRIHNHSLFADFDYLHLCYDTYARAMMRWQPDDSSICAHMNELMYNVDQSTIDWVVAERLEALRLNQLSIDDVDLVKEVLKKDTYKTLKHQFTLQRDFIKASILHMEAYLRYRIQRQHPSEENLKKFNIALKELELQADYVHKTYREEVPIISAALIRRYITQSQNAMNVLQE